ncbi:MAG: hypothetical protein Q4F17_02590 [Eubacteriales bacterium]|nr:hypothetical protein [Eubacteriales bacterium]
MQKADVLRIVNALKFDRRDFWIVAGSAMCVYGLRQETNDVDLGCTTHLADELERSGCCPVYLSDGSRKFAYHADVEIFENFLFDEVKMLDGVPIISLPGLLEMKRFLGRKKDAEDIKKLEQYLGICNSEGI